MKNALFATFCGAYFCCFYAPEKLRKAVFLWIFAGQNFLVVKFLRILSRLKLVVFRFYFCSTDNIILKMSHNEFDEFLRITKPSNSTPNKCSFDHELMNEIFCDISMIPKEFEPPKKRRN